ncbi:MAG: hypothetical protein IH624_12455 [Phycisphaerae bacterium]|nr:hypothetical protein [Phycisphaerae bacterium]
MDNAKFSIIPYVIFILLLVNSVATFWTSNLDADAILVSVSYGLLLVVPLGFVLANVGEIYWTRNNVLIKWIIPWIIFMWLTSLQLVSVYPLRSVVRAVCFQGGPLLMFLCFFIQGRNYTDEKCRANQILFFILTVVAVCFFGFELTRGEEYLVVIGIVKVGSVLYVTMLIPWIMTYRNRGLKYILLAGVSFLVLFSFKRSALFQIVIGGSVYVLVQNMIVEQRKKVLFIILTPCVLLGLFLILSYVDKSTSGVLIEHTQHLQVDKGSGRLDMWGALWREYKTWPLIDRIVGKGFYTTYEYFHHKMTAHNDFIEALWAYGAIGFVANVLFSIYLSVKAAQMVLRRHYYAASFAFGVISFMLMSMVSYNLYTMYWSLYLLAFLGYICGMDQMEKNLLTSNLELAAMGVYEPQQEGYCFRGFEDESANGY